MAALGCERDNAVGGDDIADGGDDIADGGDDIAVGDDTAVTDDIADGGDDIAVGDDTAVTDDIAARGGSAEAFTDDDRLDEFAEYDSARAARDAVRAASFRAIRDTAEAAAGLARVSHPDYAAMADALSQHADREEPHEFTRLTTMLGLAAHLHDLAAAPAPATDEDPMYYYGGLATRIIGCIKFLSDEVSARAVHMVQVNSGVRDAVQEFLDDAQEELPAYYLDDLW